MKKGILILFLILIPALLTSQVLAAGRIRFGKLKVIPAVTVKATFDDNIYLGNGSNSTTEREESDIITVVEPSIFMEYSLGPRGKVRAGYEGTLNYYADEEDQNWSEHRGIVEIDYRAPGGLILGLTNVYADTSDPYTSVNNFRLGDPQADRWSNRLNTRVGWEFHDRFRVFGYYNYFKQNYEERRDFTQDFDEHEVGTAFQMRVFPKTWAFLSYHYGMRDYPTHHFGSNESNDSDYDWHRANLGLTWDSGAKLSGAVSFGYGWKRYENSRDLNGNPYEDEDTWIASTAVWWEATPNTILALNISRSLRESFSTTNEYFVDTGIGLSVKQRLLPKLTLTAGAAYSWNDYKNFSTGSRDDDNYRFDVALDYKFREWLTTGLEYRYWEKDSSVSANDFTVNQVSLYVRLIY